MRLLSVKTLQLKQFNDEDSFPRYAILSHTWGEEEVTLPDLHRENVSQMKGYEKIRMSCECARMHGLDYIWIDTCCIDKSSSAELSEAINSMFQWYERSACCYAYLQDVKKPHETFGDAKNEENLASRLKQSRYWTRGWTLQELISPRKMWFYDENWEFIGTRKDLGFDIAKITAIDRDVLTGREGSARSVLGSKSIAQRMSWVASRKTTRQEDLAYCLLGIFDINMPLLYGEGITKAFHRLQGEIIRTSTDQTILAWSSGSFEWSGGLAPHPRYFASCSNLVAVPDIERVSELTNLGLKITVRLLERWANYDLLVILACRQQDDFFNLSAIPLWERTHTQRTGRITSFQRHHLAPLVPVPITTIDAYDPPYKTIYLQTTPHIDHFWFTPEHIIFTGWPEDATITAYPADRWNASTRTMHLRDLEEAPKSGAFAITMIPANSFRAITFGIGVCLAGYTKASIKLFP